MCVCVCVTYRVNYMYIYGLYLKIAKPEVSAETELSLRVWEWEKSVVYFRVSQEILFCPQGYKYLPGNKEQREERWQVESSGRKTEVVFIVQTLIRVQLLVTSWTAACQDPLPSTISWRSLIKSMSTESVVLCNCNSDALCCPLVLCHQFFPASGSFLMSLYISWSNSPSVLVLPMNIQGWFSLGLMVWSPCCPRDSQESSIGPQFESTNYLALSSLYDLILTSIHDYWNHKFDNADLCCQSDISAF